VPPRGSPQAAPVPASERKALFPLWAKLGLLFGLGLAVFLSLYGMQTFNEEVEREFETHRKQMLGLAKTLAAGIDAEEHRTFLRVADRERASYKRMQEWLRVSVEANHMKWAGTLVQESPGRWVYGVDSTPAGPLPPTYPIFDITEAHEEAWKGRTVFSPGFVDEWGRWNVAFAPIKDSKGAVVGVVELDADADLVDYSAQVRRQRLLMEILAGVAITTLLSVLIARYISRNLRKLTHSALRVAAGDLEQEVAIESRDEIGVLGGAFSEMVGGLRERELIRASFGRYVSEEVASVVLSDPHAQALGGEERRVTVLMSDLRGFTALSGELGPSGMVALLNRYFTRMADVILELDGTLSEFTGDGIVAFFGAPRSHADDSLRACACAVAMHRALAEFNAEEGRRLEMGVGIHTGAVIAGNIGSLKRMKYGVVGAPINLAARLESFTVGNQVLISASTWQEVQPQAQVGERHEFLAKGKHEPLVGYPVLAVSGPNELSMPTDAAGEAPLRSAGLAAVCQRVRGKEIDATPLPAHVTALSPTTLVVRASWPADERASLKLELDVGAAGKVQDVYAKVERTRPDGVGGFCHRLRLTPLPASSWDKLEVATGGSGESDSAAAGDDGPRSA